MERNIKTLNKHNNPYPGEYYLGLDIGTSSIGWAVTNDKYELIRRKGKDMWGAHTFPEALTAAERRVFRGAGRRQQREKQRLHMLRSLFEEEINRIDDGFFRRMDESNLRQEDRGETGGKYFIGSLNKGELSNSELEKKYPSMSHLRSELIHNPGKHDIRLVYLAIHNILKRRGHFLFADSLTPEGLSEKDVVEKLESLFKSMDVKCDGVNFAEVVKVLNTTKGLKSGEVKNNAVKVGKIKDTAARALIGMLSGGSSKISVLFRVDPKENTAYNVALDFSSSDIDDKLTGLEGDIEDTHYDILTGISSLFNWLALNKIMGDSDFISDARIAMYSKHHQDKAVLKKVIQKYCPDKYESFFCEARKKSNNYVAYVGKDNEGNIVDYKCNDAKFMKYVTDFIDKNIDKEIVNEDVEYIKTMAETGDFCPKIMSSANAVIPMSLHLHELEKILENASKHYPFLNVADNDNVSVRDKVISIFKFRVPYFVGVTNENSPYSWIVKNELSEGDCKKITPWNFDKIINLEATGEEFITRMTSLCTYMHGEKVLSKDSVLHSAFVVLNGINKLKVNGHEITVELKQQIFKDLYLTKKEVSLSAIKKYIQEVTGDKNISLTGIADENKYSMNSYVSLKNILKDKITVENILHKTISDDVITDINLFKNNRGILKNRLQKNYSDFLTPAEIEQVTKLSFSGWGRISEKFLTGFKSCVDNHGEMNIIEALWNTNYNLMELLGNKFGFSKKIEEINRPLKADLTINDEIEDSYLSPSAKRSVRRTFKIVDEIIEIMGKNPARIFVENTRFDGAKEIKLSRKAQLVAKYDKFKKSSDLLIKEALESGLYNELNTRSEQDFLSKRIMLYFMQMGFDPYTGKKIPFEDVLEYSHTNNKYDIDHIVPRKFMKNDSIHNNLVLTARHANQAKKDIYPIPWNNIGNERPEKLWKILKDKGLMSSEKYEALMRTAELTPNDKVAFIERQLVFTGYSTKFISDVLKRYYSDTVVYSKAANVSEFRKKFKLYKFRGLGDSHHAKDAYLNVVVGNVYHSKFTGNPTDFIRKEGGYNLNTLFDVDKNSKPVRSFYGNRVVWDYSMFQTVRKILDKNSTLTTRMSEKTDGMYYNLNIVSKAKINKAGKNTEVIFQKENKDPKVYGGYKSIKMSYFVVIRHEGEPSKTTKRKKKQITKTEILGIPVMVKDKLRTPEEITGYFAEKGYVNPVFVGEINVGDKIVVEGMTYYLNGKSGNSILVSLAVNPYLDSDTSEYLRVISKESDKLQELISKSGKKSKGKDKEEEIDEQENETIPDEEEIDIEEEDKIAVAADKLKDNNGEFDVYVSKTVSREKNLEIYDKLLAKLQSPAYKNMINNIGKKLAVSKDVFASRTLTTQVILLNNIRTVLEPALSMGVNLSGMGYSKYSGKMSINNTLKDDSSVILIKESITGIYSKRSLINGTPDNGNKQFV